MATALDILDPARDILQDREEPYRYSTDSLIRLINLGLLTVRSLRPDHYVGTYHHAMPRVTATSDEVPVSEQLVPALVAFVAGAAELRDDEFTTDGRAASMLQQFRRDLIGNDPLKVKR